MIDVLRIAHLRIAPQEGNSEVGNCEVHRDYHTRAGCLFPLVSLAFLFKLKPLCYIPDAPDEMTRLVMKARA